jgi:selenocysteine-specific elongation factor
LDPDSKRPGAHLVLGTAGHIDHGKTALVRALTGVDTDRLPEEKARGITIELGFAPLDLEGGARLSVIDVPGHEALVRTMVAGATGIDLVLLVVAADEGVMPQTREHVAICELLGIRSGVAALTKIDAADPGVAELAAQETAELLAGSALAGCPIVRVSAQTGEGIAALRQALSALAAAACPRTPRSGPPRLSIDRSFAARGFGSVVTGTLVGGAFRVGDPVELHPGGQRGRVRGLQSHGVASESCPAGVRCAINVGGIELSELARGRVLSRPGALAPTALLDAELWWLESAPPLSGLASVEFLAGAAALRARAGPIGARTLAPGGRGFARIHLEGEPVALLPGDRFIVRGFARTALGGATLGGGSVVDVAPPHRRRSDPELLRELESLARGEPAERVRVRVRRAGLAGIPAEELARQTGLAEGELESALEEPRSEGHLARTPGGRWLEESALEGLERRLLAALAAWHAAEPIRPGMPTGALRGALPENVGREVADLVLERLATRGAIALEEELVRRSDHRPRLDASDRALLERIAAEARAAGLEPPSLRDWSARLGVGAGRLRELLAHLEREERLVRAPGELWFDREAVAALRARVQAHLRAHGRLETPAYKSLIGTTRRTAVPLMELLDAERVTVRRGEVRLPGRG